MSVEHFLYPVRWDEGEHYVIWFTDDVDGVLLDDCGRILNFRSQKSARSFAESRSIVMAGDASSALDLTWISNLAFDTVDCVRTLEAWNLFADVAASLNNPDYAPFFALSTKLSGTYDKLFWGNNLPAVTPPGERYVPEWSAEELAEIGLIFNLGLKLFLNNLAPIAQ